MTDHDRQRDRKPWAPEVSDDMLLAYLDGALGGEAAEAVAERAAADREVARRMLDLDRLRQATLPVSEDDRAEVEAGLAAFRTRIADSMDDSNTEPTRWLGPMPKAALGPATRKRLQPWYVSRVLATAAGFVLAVGGSVVLLWTLRSEPEADFVANARAPVAAGLARGQARTEVPTVGSAPTVQLMPTPGQPSSGPSSFGTARPDEEGARVAVPGEWLYVELLAPNRSGPCAVEAARAGKTDRVDGLEPVNAKVVFAWRAPPGHWALHLTCGSTVSSTFTLQVEKPGTE